MRRRKKSRKKSGWDELPSEEMTEDGNYSGRCQYMGIWNRGEGIEKTKKDRIERLSL